MTTPATPVRGRTITRFAVGALVLDGVLLLLWRRHRRALAELAGARAGMRAEASALRDQ